MSENQIGDTNIIRRLPTSGIPLGIDEVSYQNYTIPTGSINTLTITTTTEVKELSLFNWAFTVYVEALDPENKWPQGNNLTSTTRSIRCYGWQDWATSNDGTNRKVFKFFIENYSGSTRTVWVYFKAYTYAYIAGSSGEENG